MYGSICSVRFRLRPALELHTSYPDYLPEMLPILESRIEKVWLHNMSISKLICHHCHQSRYREDGRLRLSTEAA